MIQSYALFFIILCFYQLGDSRLVISRFFNKAGLEGLENIHLVC